MHAILSFAHLGARNHASAPAEKLATYFARILESGTRLLGLLNDLLDLSKLESGKTVVRIQRCDLAAILGKVETELESLLKEREQALVVHTLTDDTTADVDGEQVQQVMVNLIANSMKFAPPDSSIDVTLVDAELLDAGGAPLPAISVTVSDRGIGIPEAELDDVFNEFVQSSKTNTGAGGTGLGLAICRNIVALHQGTISVRNNEAGGASFTFSPPRTASAQKSQAA